MPPLWLKICGQIGPTGTYNRKPLAAWFSDLLLRTKQLKARHLVITPSYQAAQGVARPLEPAYYLLLTTYYLLLTAYCLLLTTYYLLLTAYYSHAAGNAKPLKKAALQQQLKNANLSADDQQHLEKQLKELEVLMSAGGTNLATY